MSINLFSVADEYFFMTSQGMEEVPKRAVWRISEGGQITMTLSLVVDKFSTGDHPMDGPGTLLRRQDRF